MSSPIWISHRGFCQRATENTAAAFDAALSLGFTHLETDLRVSADGHLILAHDDNLQRICGRAQWVTQSDRQALAAVVLKGGEPLLFFDQWLERYGQYHWILDIKPEQGARTVQALLEWWRRDPEAAELLAQRARFLFWHPEHQAQLLRARPEAVCMASIAQCRRAGGACLLGLPSLGAVVPGVTYALPPNWGRIRLLRPSVVARYHRQGARVLGYLPETEQAARWALESGVDEVLTNDRRLERTT